MSAALSPDRILRSLAELWRAEAQEGEQQGVLRACALTLVTLTEEADDTAALAETLAALMPEYPARSVLVRVRPGEERELGSRIWPQCWMPFGQRRQICCEHIEITATAASLEDLPAVLEALAAPDLPTVLWTRGGALLSTPHWCAIARTAGKAIVDVASLPDPVTALDCISGLAALGARVADLSWTTLTRWRETLARVFENKEYLARLPEISQVRVSHPGPRPPATAWYLAAWLLDCLRAAGANPALEMPQEPGIEAGSLRVELSGPGFAVSLRRCGDCLVAAVGGLESRTSLPVSTDHSLMREELAIAGADPVFERALAAAARLALERGQ